MPEQENILDSAYELRKEETTSALGYLVLRVCLGVNIAMHGFSRLMAGLHRYHRFSLDRFRVARQAARFAVVSTALWAAASAVAYAAVPGPPVLVELFTSEGCSSCPPADAMLAEISRTLPGVIVLSEHVDYWNRLGWTDPYSSTESTRRQTDYAQRLGAEGPYTPQMVVNGTRQFVGGDRGALRRALVEEAGKPALALTVARVGDEKPRNMRVDVKLERSAVAGRLMAVLVQNQGQQQVARGENGGRTLTHVAIAREFHDLGDVQASRGFAGQTTFSLPGGERAAGFHVVVFLQKGAGGEVLAVASTGTT